MYPFDRWSGTADRWRRLWCSGQALVIHSHSDIQNCNARSQQVTMFFTLNEIVQWIGLTVFEIWINLITIAIFTVLLALKIDGVVNSAWWTIFAPLFVSDAMNAYFCCIVCIRMTLEVSYKASLYRVSWSCIFLGLTFVFKFLLCRKLQGDSAIEYSEVFAPLFILLQLIAVRACQLHQ